jgi:hypothetical protein
MAKGYWNAKKTTCNFCGGKDGLAKVAHRTVVCRHCAERTGYLREWLKSSVQFDDGGEGLSEWLDEKQARDDARGLESEAYTYDESEARRKESHT